MSRSLAVRRQADAYYTEDALARALVSLLPIGGGTTVWEPHAGGGAFVRALSEQGAYVVASDITEWMWPTASHVFVADFLALEPDPARDTIPWIVGNPPFRDFEKHVDQALRFAENVAFLLRLAVMESAKRAPLWERWPLRKVWVLAERPSFTGGGTDSAAYGFFHFSKGWGGPAEGVPGWRWK